MIKFSRFMDELRALAIANPEKTAECHLFGENGAPVCIVGHAFVNLGVPVTKKMVDHYAQLAVNDEVVGDASNTVRDMRDYWPKLGIRTPTKRQELWAHEVQLAQDTGMPWADAVEHADWCVKNVAWKEAA